MLFGLEAFISRVSAASRHITCGEHLPPNSNAPSRSLAAPKPTKGAKKSSSWRISEKAAAHAMLATPLQPQPEPAQAANPLARLDFDAAEAQSPTRGSGKKDPLRPSIGGACASLCPSLPATFA